MRWHWRGLFSLEVPPSWEVQESEGLIQIVPPRPTGAATISVLTASPAAPIGPDRARVILLDFATKQGAAPEHIEGLPSSSGLRTSFGPREPGGLFWDIQVNVFGETVVRCSFCHGGEDGDIRTAALAMFDSLQAAGSLDGAPTRPPTQRRT